MAYTFQSRATADLIMLDKTAEQILKLLDKPLGTPGIITVEQIPAALQMLEHAAIEDEAQRKGSQEQQSEDEQAQIEAGTAAVVTLRQRLVPLMDMLRRSEADNQPVTWRA